MKFLKIGDAFINLDLVTDIEVDRTVDPNRVYVFLAAPTTAVPGIDAGNQGMEARRLSFRDDEAEALLRWFIANAEDVMPAGFAGVAAVDDDDE